mmetsp:Transcript_97612/g.254542  ORF Transcript_97612/g.254542 Transcript_97612/m.254542 type:complete len:290 (-) Transcript_97612:527-1396(-)
MLEAGPAAAGEVGGRLFLLVRLLLLVLVLLVVLLLLLGIAPGVLRAGAFGCRLRPPLSRVVPAALLRAHHADAGAARVAEPAHHGVRGPILLREQPYEVVGCLSWEQVPLRLHPLRQTGVPGRISVGLQVVQCPVDPDVLPCVLKELHLSRGVASGRVEEGGQRVPDDPEGPTELFLRRAVHGPDPELGAHGAQGHRELVELRHHGHAMRAPVDVELDEPELSASRDVAAEQVHVQVDDGKLAEVFFLNCRQVEQLLREFKLSAAEPSAVLGLLEIEGRRIPAEVLGGL